MDTKDDIPAGAYCDSIFEYKRRETDETRIGGITIGGSNPVAVQSMTDTDTNDTEACVAQIGRIRKAGGRIVRLTAQGAREGENLAAIAARVRESYPDVALVADVHFLPEVASIAAKYVDKVRINPGNYHDKGGDFEALLELCASRGVALRIGVNHGSLSEKIMERWGDTPEGMVASAMEFLRVCRERDFANVVVSMKSSNTRVMVHAYRLLAAEMRREGMKYPIHLGVTEAGDGQEGRIKSAVGIGALLTDGIGDTIRVSLTEPPENEIPVALTLTDYFAERGAGTSANKAGKTPKDDSFGCPNNSDGNDRKDIDSGDDTAKSRELFDPFSYRRRETKRVGRLGGGNTPLLWSETDCTERVAAENGDIAVVSAGSKNPVGEWRRAIADMHSAGDRRPVVLHRKYDETEPEKLMVKAAADFGVMFIDGLADGIYLETDGIPKEILDGISLDIMQASRARISKTDFIACPGCGRTLFDLHGTLKAIKERTSHLKGLKIGVMGCIVNGPGEMADADYGYVGAAPGHITLYRGREAVTKNIPQSDALDALVELIKTDGRWVDEE